MYIPPQFREDRRDVLIAAMRAIRFGALVATAEDEFDAVHLPVLVREHGDEIWLDAHVAHPNGFWRLAHDGRRAVALLQGPHAYIRPGWFETKRETGKGVPTWNYVAIHCHGELTAIDDTDWLLDHVRTLSDLNEAGRAEPWSVDDAPEGYIERLSKAIVGLRLRVERMEGAWKFIQHHPEGNRRAVREGLSASANPLDRAVGEAMAHREQDLARLRSPVS